jgi:hypothetical protein
LEIGLDIHLSSRANGEIEPINYFIAAVQNHYEKMGQPICFENMLLTKITDYEVMESKRLTTE